MEYLLIQGYLKIVASKHYFYESNCESLTRHVNHFHRPYVARLFLKLGETGEGCYDFYKNVENSPFSTSKISNIFMVSNQTPSLLKDIINKILSLRD